MAIVGHILNYPHLIYETRLEPEMFYKTCNSLIFKAFCNMREQGKNIDLMTVAEELKAMKVLDDVGGFYYLTNCSENVFSSASFQSHEEIIINKYLRRKVIMRSQEFMSRSYRDDEKIEEIIFDMAHANVEIEGRKDDTIKGAMLEAIDYVDAASNMEFTGFPTGIRGIDEMTSGLQRGDLIVIGGRPSNGKTALASQIMINTAVNHQIPTGMISIEMPKRQIGMRMAAQITKIDFFSIRTGRLSALDRTKFNSACGTLADTKIFIDDPAGCRLSYIDRKIHEWNKKHGVCLVLIDYLQLVQLPGFGKKNDEIGDLTKQLKAIAKRLDIAVVVLSQLSRNNERESRRPMLSDLRDSGNIEQDADLVIATHLEHEKDPNATLIILKQRNGPIGDVTADFKKYCMTFKEKIIMKNEPKDMPE